MPFEEHFESFLGEVLQSSLPSSLTGSLMTGESVNVQTMQTMQFFSEGVGGWLNVRGGFTRTWNGREVTDKVSSGS